MLILINLACLCFCLYHLVKYWNAYPGSNYLWITGVAINLVVLIVNLVL